MILSNRRHIINIISATSNITSYFSFSHTSPSKEQEIFQKAINENDLLAVDNLLTSQKINKTTVFNNGKTPLHLAIKEKNAEIIKVLLKHGLSPVMTDSQGLNAVDVAIMMNQSEHVQVLLSNILNLPPNASDIKKNELSNLNIDSSVIENFINFCKQRNFNDSTFTHISNAIHNIQIRQNDLRHKSLLPSKEGIYAEASFRGDLQKLEELFNHSKEQEKLKGEEGIQLLKWAILGNQRKAFDKLVESGVNPAQFDKENNLLFCAVLLEDLYWVERLLNLGVNVNNANKEGLSPVHVTGALKNLNILRLLVSKGAELQLKDKQGCSSLLFLIGSILENDSLNATQTEGIMAVALLGHLALEFLLSNGMISGEMAQVIYITELCLSLGIMSALINFKNYSMISNLGLFGLGSVLFSKFFPFHSLLSPINAIFQTLAAYRVAKQSFAGVKAAWQNKWDRPKDSLVKFMCSTACSITMTYSLKQAWNMVYEQFSFFKTINANSELYEKFTNTVRSRIHSNSENKIQADEEWKNLIKNSCHITSDLDTEAMTKEARLLLSTEFDWNKYLLEEGYLKKIFNKISLTTHPDKGGNSETYQQILALYKKLKIYKSTQVFEDIANFMPIEKCRLLMKVWESWFEHTISWTSLTGRKITVVS